MKIIFVTEYYPPAVMGGGEINLVQTAQALAKTHEVVVLTSHFPDLLPEEAVEGVYILRRLRTGKNTATLSSNLQRRFLFPRSVEKEVHKLMKEFDPDIFHFIGTSIIAAPKLRKLGRKMFATIESYPALCPKGDRLFKGRQECTLRCNLRHFVFCQQESDEIGKMKNYWYLKYNPLFLWLAFRYFQRLNQGLAVCHLIAISGYVEKILQQYGHSSTVIPNTFDAVPFQRGAAKKVAGRINAKPLILYAGALIKSKGPQILLEALRGLNCRVELYSQGVLKEELQAYIQRYHLNAEIFSPLPYQQVPEMYAGVDIVVFPSLWPEPFGRIPLEAIAAGKPIIASDIGAIPEIVGKRGFLITPGDAAALRTALQDILQHPLTKSKTKSKVLLTEYKPETIVSKLEQAYGND